jgi:hypothetical protein
MCAAEIWWKAISAGTPQSTQAVRTYSSTRPGFVGDPPTQLQVLPSFGRGHKVWQAGGLASRRLRNGPMCSSVGWLRIKSYVAFLNLCHLVAGLQNYHGLLRISTHNRRHLAILLFRPNHEQFVFIGARAASTSLDIPRPTSCVIFEPFSTPEQTWSPW